MDGSYIPDASNHEDRYWHATGIDGHHRRHPENHPSAENVPAAHRSSVCMPHPETAIHQYQRFPQPEPNVSFHGTHPWDDGSQAFGHRSFQQSTPVPRTGHQDMRRAFPTQVTFYPSSNYFYVGAKTPTNSAAQRRDWLPLASHWSRDDHLTCPWTQLTSTPQVSLDPSYPPGGSAPFFSGAFHSEPASIWGNGGGPSLSDPVAEQQPKVYSCRLAKNSNQSGRHGTSTTQGGDHDISLFVICGQCFHDPDLFITHVKETHKIRNSKKKSTEEVECAWGGCNRKMTPGSYHRHIVEKHGGIPRDRLNEQKPWKEGARGPMVQCLVWI